MVIFDIMSTPSAKVRRKEKWIATVTRWRIIGDLYPPSCWIFRKFNWECQLGAFAVETDNFCDNYLFFVQDKYYETLIRLLFLSLFLFLFLFLFFLFFFFFFCCCCCCCCLEFFSRHEAAIMTTSRYETISVLVPCYQF